MTLAAGSAMTESDNVDTIDQVMPQPALGSAASASLRKQTPDLPLISRVEAGCKQLTWPFDVADPQPDSLGVFRRAVAPADASARARMVRAALISA